MEYAWSRRGDFARLALAGLPILAMAAFLALSNWIEDRADDVERLGNRLIDWTFRKKEKALEQRTEGR